MESNLWNDDRGKLIVENIELRAHQFIEIKVPKGMN